MRIGLMGFECESPNKGCEALVYSFLNIIENSIDTNTVIVNFSGTPLGMIPETFPRIKFENVYFSLRDLKFRFIRELKKCDIVFDVTMGDSFSDIYSKNYYDKLVIRKRLGEFFCKKYVFLPQTYGPFSKKESEVKAQKVLERAYKIYCRDELSQRFLVEKMGIQNAILCSDMAFVLPFDRFMYSFSNKTKIGINVSGLLYRGGFYSKNQFGLSLDYQKLMELTIATLEKKYEVHLIPHVIDMKNNAYDDDFKVCQRLHEQFSGTILAPAFDTPIQAKSYIANMNIFIGSRMHSTIAAFSSGVATIPISYSRKFEGLFGSLNYPFVINAVKEDTESAFRLIKTYIDEESSLREAQNLAMSMVEKKNAMLKKEINEIIAAI